MPGWDTPLRGAVWPEVTQQCAAMVHQMPTITMAWGGMGWH